MATHDLTGDAAAVARIRNYLMTLRRFRDTSMALHGRPVESVNQLATEVAEQINWVVKAYPESAEVARWKGKFEEYVKQYKLVVTGKEGRSDAKTGREEGTLQPNVRQDRPKSEAGG